MTVKTSPTMTSLLKTTPFRSFLSRSTSSQNNENDSNKSDFSFAPQAKQECNIRYSRSHSFEANDQNEQITNAKSQESIQLQFGEKVQLEQLSINENNYQKTNSNLLLANQENKQVDEVEQKEKNPTINAEFHMKKEQKERLLQLHRVLGDSIFLIEKLRNHPLTLNPLMSPLLSDDSVLAKFPKTYLIVSSHLNFFITYS